MNPDEREIRARRHQYTRQTFIAGPCLVAIHPNQEGWIAVIPYDGRPYDASKYRIEATGWDHQHCSVCEVRIDEGDTWWVAPPPNEVGLCENCHARLFTDKAAS
jgi:hypothetical protein